MDRNNNSSGNQKRPQGNIQLSGKRKVQSKKSSILKKLFPAKKNAQEKVKRNTGKKTTKKVFSTIAMVFLTIFLVGIITGTIVVGAFAIYIKEYIDPVIEDFDVISTDQNLSSKIYYMNYTDRENREGEAVELSGERLYGSENRVWVNFNEMPSYLYEAFIAIEDERFWTHSGVDWKRTFGATFFFFTGGDNYGGSTITQQLIKNLTGENEVRIQRKLQEIMRALYLDKTKDKTEILELYLNTIYLSQGCYGVQAAANVYFNKDVSELTLVECAALASITQAPTKWDPKINPDNNKYRRTLVLDKMLELSKITQSEYDEAINTELNIYKSTGTAEGEIVDTEKEYNSWYTDAVIKSVVERLVKEKGIPENLAYNMVYSGGLNIYTVMDPDVQSTLENVYENSTVFQTLPGVVQPESSMVIIDPSTGDVLGLIGGRGKKSGNLLLNYATDTVRSPGSSIKPLTVYAPALEDGLINYASVYDDVPVNFDTGKYTVDPDTGDITYVYKETGQTVTRNTGWPSNLPTTYSGLVNINYALQVSKNTIAVRVLQDLTCEKSFNFAKNKLHMDSLIEKLQLSNGEWITDKGLAALALGEMNYGVTNLEITAAYSIFINNGIYNQPRLYTQVTDNEGNIVLDDGCKSEVVISEQNATIMTKMLQNVVNQGTAKAVSLRGQVNVAGKTGTTNSDHDRWFVGYTPYMIGGVWYGYAEPDSLSRVSGNPAANIWNEVMTILHQKYIDGAKSGTPLKTFVDANGIVTAKVCTDSGKLMTAACKADPRGNREETCYFTRSTVPTEPCDCHILVEYDKATKAIACSECPPENVVKIGLLDITSRNFPVDVRVTDAQYVYRKLSGDANPGGWAGIPFYYNDLDGKFAGYTGGYGSNQFNHYCYTHYTGKKPSSDTSSTAKPEETTTPTTP